MIVPRPSLLWLALAFGIGGCRSAPAQAIDRLDPEARASVARLDCAGVRELNSVFFARGSAALRLDADGPGGRVMRLRLDENVAVLERCPTITVRVFGYAHASEGETVDLALSQSRADAVRDHYLAGGIAADRVTDASGRGVAPEARVGTDTAERPPNGARRVDSIPSAPGP